MANYTHQTNKPDNNWLSQQPFNKAQRSYRPGQSANDDSRDLEQYLNELMRSSPSRARNGYITSEEDWETVPPLHRVRNPSSQANSLESWRKDFPDANMNSVIQRRDLVGNLLPYIDEYNKQRVASGNKGRDYESQMREFDKFIRGETERLGNLPPAEFQRKSPSTSFLTQKATGLREDRANRERLKGKPYSGKINNLLEQSKTAPGFTSEHTNSLLDYLRNEGVRGNNDIVRKHFNDEFRGIYKGQDQSFNNFTNEALDKDQLRNKIDFKNLSGDFSNSQGKVYRDLTSLFKKAGKGKEDKENKLIEASDRFGNQQHAYGNLINDANKRLFDLEAFEPYSKLSNLRTARSNIELEPGNPNSEQKARGAMQKALADYGILGGKNANFWNQSRSSSKPKFTEGLIEELPPEVLESQYTINSLNPKFKGEHYNTRKSLEKDLYGSKATLADDFKDKSLGNIAYKKAMEDAPDEIKLLDYELEDAIDKANNQARNKYTRLNQYRSPQHVAESEQKAKELTSMFAKKRSDILSNKLKSSGEQEKNRIYNQMGLLNDTNDLDNQSFNNIIDRAQETNNLGIRNWHNAQSTRDQDTNQKLRSLGLLNNIPSIGGKHTNFINPGDEANFRARGQDYLNRGVLKDFSSGNNSMYLNDLKGVAHFNQNEKENDPYAQRNTNNIQHTAQLNPVIGAHQEAAANKFKSGKEAALNRKTRIEGEYEKEREANLQKADANSRALPGNDHLKMKGLIDSLNNNEVATFNNSWERIAKLLEQNNLAKFALNPQTGSRTGLGIFHPREKDRIVNLAQKYLMV